MTTATINRSQAAELPGRDGLVLSYLNHVDGLLRMYAASTRMDYDDLRQDACIVIMHCLDIKPGQESTLHGYVATSVRNRIIDKIRYNQRRQAVSLDALHDAIGDQDSGATPDDLLPSGYNTDPLMLLLAKADLEVLKAWTETREAWSRAASTRRMYRELADTVLASLSLDEEVQP